MKKTLKKLTALLLVSIMLIASVPVQSFAAFKIPIIKSIEFSEKSQVISMKELDNYYKSIFDELEEYGITMDKLMENYPSLYSNLHSFSLYSSNFNYEYIVTLATGKKYTLSSENANIELNKFYSLEADGIIAYETYLQAKESGSKEIEIELYGCLYNNATYEYCDITEYTTTSKLSLVDMVVKSVTPISGVPDKIYADADYVDIEGAKFLVEYSDGRVTTAEAIRTSDADDVFYDNYTLDGNELFVWSEYDYDKKTDENVAKYCFEYLDATFETPAEFSYNSLFKSVKITDCDFDLDTAVLKSISYELTYDDGRVLSFTKDFTQEEEEMLIFGKDINYIDGYTVSVFLTVGGYDIFSDTINVETFDIELSIGEHSDVYKVDIPNKEIVNGLLNVFFFFENIIEKFHNIIDFIFFPFF